MGCVGGVGGSGFNLLVQVLAAKDENWIEDGVRN
jgi:hypothetical protein